MFNPNDSRSLDRLARAVDFSRWRLQPFRENRLSALRNFVGAHYSWSGSQQRVPLNLLQLACNIYLRQLVSRAPRAMVSARDPNLKPVAADMQSWMDKATVGMRLAESLRVCVLNALFSIGIMKVGEALVDQIEVLGTTQCVGQPFAEPVDLDDWVHDITAKRFDQVQFCGNRYRVSLEEAKEDPNFDKVARQSLSAQTRFAYNERGDVRSTTLSQSTMQLYDEYQDHVELWDMWLPKEKLILVMPYQDSVEGGFYGSRPLKVIEWKGPQEGPFITLSYCDVPNNVMPAAPLQALQDMHDLVNILWRKLARQGERQKTILGVMGTATDDAERINRSNDGEAVRVDFPDRCQELSFGGIKAENLAATIQAKDLFVYMAGNLDALGGLSPQAQTLGQDELLNKNSAAQIAEMQDRTVNFTQDVYKRLAWQWWTNPVLTYSSQRQLAGFNVPVSITPQMRQMPFEAFDWDIDPYSMQHQTPQTRLAQTMQVLQTIILPALPMMQQQGLSVKWPAVLAMIAKYSDVPDLKDLIAQRPPPQMAGAAGMAQQAMGNAQGGGGGQPPGMPPVTTRRNIRINRPGATSGGQSQIMSQLLAGSNLQPGQAAAVGRPTG